MSNHDNTNRGAIWPTKEKKKDTWPDFEGNLNVEGVEYWVSAWKRKEGANPKSPSLSFSIKRKDSAAPADYEKTRPSTGANREKPSDLPF